MMSYLKQFAFVTTPAYMTSTSFVIIVHVTIKAQFEFFAHVTFNKLHCTTLTRTLLTTRCKGKMVEAGRFAVLLYQIKGLLNYAYTAEICNYV